MRSRPRRRAAGGDVTRGPGRLSRFALPCRCSWSCAAALVACIPGGWALCVRRVGVDTNRKCPVCVGFAGPASLAVGPVRARGAGLLVKPRRGSKTAAARSPLGACCRPDLGEKQDLREIAGAGAAGVAFAVPLSRPLFGLPGPFAPRPWGTQAIPSARPNRPAAPARCPGFAPRWPGWGRLSAERTREASRGSLRARGAVSLTRVAHPNCVYARAQKGRRARPWGAERPRRAPNCVGVRDRSWGKKPLRLKFFQGIRGRSLAACAGWFFKCAPCSCFVA